MRIVKLNINGEITKYNLPTSWNEVSIGEYSKLMRELDSDDVSEIQLIIKSLEALLNIELGLISKVPIKQLKQAYSQLQELTSTMPNIELNRVIEIKGIEYGIIPNFDELTLGEFVDLDNYLQDSWINLDKIFSVLYRPILKRDGDDYIIEDYDLKSVKDRREVFKSNLSIDTCYGALVFFYLIGRKQLDNTLSSLEIESKSQNITKMSLQ
tara:strand:+ start:2510 stop:3142 length:633 start_codon:yes stop_codon:yes gene_type:complete